MSQYSPYLREQKFPLIWCAGCGHGIVMKAIPLIGNLRHKGQHVVVGSVTILRLKPLLRAC